mmetsp:Transcript_110638/g.174349  ORF Transcript_110638/g.174349 Transcript_110638/m.174349 type:complete len:152 (-) Transcript_110638:194-649(-)|eukprot:CAMPEP_0169162492 /NCGR_PEP_ID=MMETSP1015-20121227/57675_1 /TAXON_ID=342587 /ORGANISM="Karlodinium micrum, Strain CCMP2283" /LENGTH=151 /DNA_ID=CAMNT_0009234555 /DNA_START=43 /DNA_END=498 /DNA_ORIENTATION=-
MSFDGVWTYGSISGSTLTWRKDNAECDIVRIDDTTFTVTKSGNTSTVVLKADELHWSPGCVVWKRKDANVSALNGHQAERTAIVASSLARGSPKDCNDRAKVLSLSGSKVDPDPTCHYCSICHNVFVLPEPTLGMCCARPVEEGRLVHRSK